MFPAVMKGATKSGKKATEGFVHDKVAEGMGFQGQFGKGFSKKGMMTDVLGQVLNKGFQTYIKQKGIPEAVMRKGVNASLKYLAKNGAFQEAIMIPIPRVDLVKFIKETSKSAGIPQPVNDNDDDDLFDDDDDSMTNAWKLMGSE